MRVEAKKIGPFGPIATRRKLRVLGRTSYLFPGIQPVRVGLGLAAKRDWLFTRPSVQWSTRYYRPKSGGCQPKSGSGKQRACVRLLGALGEETFPKPQVSCFGAYHVSSSSSTASISASSSGSTAWAASRCRLSSSNASRMPSSVIDASHP
jgi:hypothetical protein